MRQFHARGVFWRRLLRWGVLNVPPWLEPAFMALWSFVFLVWASGRRGVMRNLAAILPHSWALANLARVYRVFWNFAWTIADNVRFRELRVTPDWEFEGFEHFERLQSQPGGAIILTAHMGSYDLAAQLFAERSARSVVMVRAPETDEETRRFEEDRLARAATPGLTVGFTTRADELALDLLHALQNGQIVAIQGDRVTPGISSLQATLFGKPARVPAGPFALAMTARVPIYPLFIIRLGRRRYRLRTGPPMEVARTRDRGEAFGKAAAQWTKELEIVVRGAWYQWFAFQPFAEEPAA